MAKDYYETLGIQGGASADEIKAAYRKMAMKYHPDKNKGDAKAEEQFKEINAAYETLKDPQKKAAYDRYGHSAYTQNGGSSAGGFQGGFQGGGGFGGFSDIFESMFRQAGGFQGGGFSAHNDMDQFYHNKGKDIRYNLDITLEEAYHGKNAKLNFSTFVECKSCDGQGGENGAKPTTCHTCQGHGKVHMQQSIFIVEKTCTTCSGTGQIIKNACKSCHGQGRMKKEKNLEVNIPSGIENGMKIRVAEAGEAGLRGAGAGDLYVFIHVKPHKMFKRDGQTIHCKVPLTMVTATCGGEIEVPSIDGERLSVKIPAGTQPGNEIRIKQKGMKGLRASIRGDMVIEASVEIPVNLSQRQKELLEEFASESKEHNNSPASQGFFAKVKDFWEDISKNSK